MIYLNQAATSYPKPPSVSQAVTQAMNQLPQSSLRSSLSDRQDIVGQLRVLMAELLQTPHVDRVYFSSGATDSLNRLIGGLGNVRMAAIADNHNSVLRPLFNRNAAKPVILETVEQVEQMERTDWLIVPHCSNVTGRVYDIATICRMAHARGIRVMVDAAQSLGCQPMDVEGWGIDALAFTGHKALYGPQGTGGYYVSPDVMLRPTVFGGTGRDSRVVSYADGEWEYEPGTPNGPGLAGLLAGASYVMERGVDNICRQLYGQIKALIELMEEIPHVRLYCPERSEHGPLVSFNVEGLDPADVGYILQNVYGITVRTGLHCAPLCHKQMGTFPHGTVRVSISTFNSTRDIESLIDALKEITSSL